MAKIIYLTERRIKDCSLKYQEAQRYYDEARLILASARVGLSDAGKDLAKAKEALGYQKMRSISANRELSKEVGVPREYLDMVELRYNYDGSVLFSWGEENKYILLDSNGIIHKLCIGP